MYICVHVPPHSSLPFFLISLSPSASPPSLSPLPCSSPKGGQRPAPQPARPQIKEEDIKQLQEMFPTVDKEVIQSVLEASNGQVDPAVTNLLQMTQ